MYILANTKCHLQNVQHVVACVFLASPRKSREPYFMLVTPDRGPAALSHAGRAPTDFQTGMHELGLLDLSLT